MIRKSYSYCITAAFFSILFIVVTSSVSAQDAKFPLYRFWSSQNASHFYTMDEGEKNFIAGNYPEDVWKYEQVAWYAYSAANAPDGSSPIYRFWSSQNGSHFYTISEAEKDYIIANYSTDIWDYEGISYYAYASGDEPLDGMAVYRFWSDQNSSHFFTMSATEKNYISATYPESIWRYEGIAWYAFDRQDPTDNDGDGYYTDDGDCNDDDSSVYPGATEVDCDGIDQDCDGIISICNDQLTLEDVALPEGAQISIASTETPVLPDGVTPAGNAFAITSTDEPTEPALLRLPVPEGIDDPSSLAIVRVESDGTTTFLMTEVEEDELVAFTPGFSKFILVELETVLRGSMTGHIRGPTELFPGQRAEYKLILEKPYNLAGVTWKLSNNNAYFVSINDQNVIIQAAGEVEKGESEVNLNFEATDLASGKRWFSSRLIVIKESRKKVFDVSAFTQKAFAYPDEEIVVTAKVYGAFEPPLSWRWKWSDSDTFTGPIITDLTQLDLPPNSFSVTKVYVCDVAVTDDKDNTGTGFAYIRVIDEPPFSIAIDGSQRLTWDAPSVLGEYTATGTRGESPYAFTWQLLPSGWQDSSTVDETSTMFPPFYQPGEYLLKVTGEDDSGADAAATLPIVVEGGEELSTHILSLPDTAQPGETVYTQISIRGGVLVVNGKKAGYTLKLNWGDESETVTVENVGIANTPYEGTVTDYMSHSYTPVDTYQVTIEVFDAAGNSTSNSQLIEITEYDIDPPVDPPPGNTLPWANSIFVTTRQNTSVPITLEGIDTDGDDLTYSVTSGPSSGSLTGSGSSRTYTPDNNFYGSDSFTYTVNDGIADSTPGTVTITVEPLKWVRVGSPVINVNDLPLEYYGGGSTPNYYNEPRFEGKFEIYYVNETSIAKDWREVDHGYEYWNVNLSSTFDAPPQECIYNPGEIHDLTVTFTHSGRVDEYWYPSTIFEYRSDIPGGLGGLDPGPGNGLVYSPWHPEFTGENSKTWTLECPNGAPGDTFVISVGWWNCPVCNVTWTYEAQ